MFFVNVLALVFAVLIAILIVRFLWIVPNELNEIKLILKYRLKAIVEKSDTVDEDSED